MSVSQSGEDFRSGRARVTVLESAGIDNGLGRGTGLDDADEDAPSDTEIPTRIGRYVVLETIGVGGMGVVCTAYDPKLDRKVALKLLRKGRDRRRAQTSQARLVREAQALAKLSHPNIVTVHDVDTYQGQLYIAMEYVQGQSLDAWLAAQPRQPAAIVAAFVLAGRGLAAAHAAGITHRDFKPGNVQIGQDGRIRVLDFGLAKNADDADPSLDVTDGTRSRDTPATPIMDLVDSSTDAKLTQVGRTVGTPSYMAPEQFYGLTVGPQTDQFAFGVSLFEALHGRLPFGETDDADFVDAVCHGRIRDAPTGGHVPAWLNRIVLRMLQREPGARYPSMDAALAALTADPARRRRRWALATGLVGLVGLSSYGAGALLDARGQLCSGGEARLHEIWNDTARQRLRAAFAATQTPFARHAQIQVQSVLDEWGGRWVAHYGGICLASARGEQSDGLMDLRMACLDRGHAALAGLIEVFGEADEHVVANAVAAAQGLTNIDRCPTARPGTQGALPDDPLAAQRAKGIEARVAQADANALGGRYERAVLLAQDAQRQATALQHAPTQARAEKSLGTAYHYAQRNEAAAEHLRAAIRWAATAGMPEDEARAWSMLLYVQGDPLEQPAEALTQRLAAETALLRAGSPPMAAASLAADLGVVLSRAGRSAEALAEHQRAVALWRAIGEDRDGLAKALNNLGIALAQEQRLTEAKAALQEALAIQRRLFGDDHPIVASQRFNLGHVLRDLGDTAGARAHYLESLRVAQNLYGPDHTALAPGLVGLAKLDEDTDRDGAMRTLARAIGILQASPAPGRRLAIAQVTLAGMQIRAGREATDPAIATAQWRQTQADLRAVVGTMAGPPTRLLARAQGYLCELGPLLADPNAGRADCEQATATELALREVPDQPSG